MSYNKNSIATIFILSSSERRIYSRMVFILNHHNGEGGFFLFPPCGGGVLRSDHNQNGWGGVRINAILFTRRSASPHHFAHLR